MSLTNEMYATQSVSNHILPRPIQARNLSYYLNTIWQQFFADTPRANEVQIAYCYPWKNRLGLIRMSLDNSISFIGINALLQHPHAPECVLITTIAHELVHYTHGFGSPLPRLYEHPHANNIIESELERRSLGEELRASDAWIDSCWYEFYAQHKASGWSAIPEMRRNAPRKQAS